ncbi:MAG TPA: LamG-like jellyroll fold domain-containing protein, partial [Candidatus Binatia bacterium]|nr:LamG-like jellyroll fold domain-containing protein [Candidatus Binatia bacterium]
SANATLTVVPNRTADVNFYRAAVQDEFTLVAFFPVDGNTDAIVDNIIDFAHDGSLSWLAGYDGRTNRSFGERALRFTGANDVTIPNSSDYEFAGGLGTVEAIVYLSGPSSAGNGTIFSLASNPGSAYYQVQASLDGSALVYKSSAIAQPLTWPVPVSLLGRFAHVAMVFSNNNITAYVDGQSLGTKTQPGFGGFTGQQANIGSSGRDFNNVVQDPWNGTIDELAIYVDALPANTVAVHNSRFVFGTAVTPPTIQSIPTGTKNLLAGGAPVFRVRASGTAPLSYQWKRNGVAISGNPTATTSDLTLDNSTTAMSGNYTVTISNPAGQTNSVPFTVNFAPPPDTYSSYVLADNPSAYWRLNETSGTTLIDYAGAIDGTYASTVDHGLSGAPGTGDSAAHFRGSGSPVANAIVPYNPTLNPTTPFTLEVWVKPDVSGQNSWAVIGNQNRNTGRAGYALYQGFNGNFWEAHLGYADTVLFIQGQTPPVAGRWDHVVVTWDGANSARLWLNGTDDTDPGSTVNGPHRPNLSVPFEIASRFGSGIPYPGTIDEIAFYNHVLTPERIRQHWSVSWAPAQIVTQPSDVPNAVEASTVTLTAVVSGYPNTYQWFKDLSPLAPSTNPDGTPHYPQGVNGATLVISQVTPSDSGYYQLHITNPLGDLETIQVNVNVNLDTSSPSIVNVTADASMHRVRVKFDRPMTPETVSVAGNYTFSGGVTATGVALTFDSTIVDVVTTALTPGAQYTLQVSGVTDQRISHNVIGPNSTTFRSYVLTPGVLAWDYYGRIPGTSVESLQSSSQFPDGVYTNGVLTNFSTMPLTGGDLNGNPGFGGQNLGSDYGIHIYGWVTPSVSGNYTFFLRSDDASQLWMSTDSDPANRSQIAVETGCCQAFLEPGAVQTSGPRALVAGQSYYIEVFNKEGGGGDFAEVAWRVEGDTTAAASLRPIGGNFLSAYASLPVPRFNPVVRNGTQVTISWTGVGTLQESSDLRNWSPVA